MEHAVLSTSSLTGGDVVNRQGHKLGALKDIMIDLTLGNIAYGVVSRGGFAGIGEKLFAVPWELFSVDTDARELILDISEDVLDNSPGFDPSSWPSFSDLGWRTDNHEHFGLVPYWTER